MPKGKIKNRFIFSQLKFGDKEFSQNEPIELITTAKQTSPVYGDFSYTKEELQEMVDAFNEDVRGVEVAVDINHSDDGKAYAWIQPKSMFVAKSKNSKSEYSIYAVLYKYTPEGEELLSTGAYRYVSLEIGYFERFIDGVKEAFNNVIYGLAITNRPVIKGLNPTFSENSNLFLNSKTMELFKILLAELAKKTTVSLSEKSTLKTLFKSLNEEEQKEVDKEVKDVEDKPEQTDEEKKAEEDTKKELAEANQKVKDAKKLAESKLSESDKQIKKLTDLNETTSKRLSEIEKVKQEENIDKKLSEVTISEDTEIGLAGESIKAAKEFAMSLSEEQATQFFDVLKTVKTLDLSEKGVEGEDDKELSDKKVKAYAEENKLTYKEALIELS